MFWQNKHREANEQAFFFLVILGVPGGGPRNIWFRHDTGNEVPWGTEATGVWRRLVISFSSPPGQFCWSWLPFNIFFFLLVKTTWHQPALEDGPGFLGEGCKQKGRRGDLGMEATAADDDTACTHTTHKIDWRFRRHQGLRNMDDTTAMLLPTQVMFIQSDDTEHGFVPAS
jgi:hypothetical protein